MSNWIDDTSFRREEPRRNRAGYTIDPECEDSNSLHHRDYGSLYRGTVHESVQDYNLFLHQSSYDR